MNPQKRIYIDMDGVLCRYKEAYHNALLRQPQQLFPQAQWGFFLKLEPMPNAIESFKLLQQHYDVWILTRPSFKNVNSYTEKAQWVWDHLGFDALQKTIFSGNKSLLKGDYLIDDSDNAHQNDFEGEWIQFGTESFENWNKVLQYLIN